MTEIKLDLAKPELFVQQLRHAAGHWSDGGFSPISDALLAAADSIEEQVKPAIEEPPGDVIVFAFGTAYKKPGGNANWYPFSPGPYYEWADLIKECYRTQGAPPVVYRNEVELTELSTEVLRIGVGEAPPTSGEEAPVTYYADGFRTAQTQIRERITKRRLGAISAERQDALDKALADVNAVSP